MLLDLPNDETPLVLNDFDGVYNALGILMGMTSWTDGVNTSASMPSGNHAFSYSPTVAGFMREVSARAYMIWLSTWFEETVCYGRVMGMPDFPAINADGLDIEPSAPWWKLQRVMELVELFPNRRILWIDDEISKNPEVRAWMDVGNGSNVTLLEPNDLTGLEPADLETIERFLNS